MLQALVPLQKANCSASIKWCFHALSFFFLLSFFQVLASHPHETIYIVFSLWDITLQPPASHLFFGEKFASAKLAASNMSHKQYIMYMYEHRSRFFFPSYRFLEWKLHIANGGSWHTKRIGAGLLYSPTCYTMHCQQICNNVIKALRLEILQGSRTKHLSTCNVYRLCNSVCMCLPGWLAVCLSVGL